MTGKKMKHQDIASLHRYFLWSTAMKRDFESALAGQSYQQDPLTQQGFILHQDVGMYMSYWYGALYVVCDGWQRLGLSDPHIDQLLNSPNLKLLRRYRNGSFHYQKTYFDARFHEFMSEGSSVQWIRNLSNAFGKWFLTYFKNNKLIV